MPTYIKDLERGKSSLKQEKGRSSTIVENPVHIFGAVEQVDSYCNIGVDNCSNGNVNKIIKNQCPLCNKVNSIDSEAHSLSCEEIIKLLPEITTKTITVNNFYSNNVQDLKKTVNIFMEVMKIRKEALSSKNS